jgi:predicted dithiol-disulfide oxidoreductase (DUF899 family)
MKVATYSEWLDVRNELLVKEKELTRRSDELAARRRELPWVRIDKEYRFDTEDGTTTLAGLFDGRPQLIVYHFMFGKDYTAGCPVCSSIADSFNGVISHLNAHDASFAVISRAPAARLAEYKKRMGWDFTWVSSGRTEYNDDFGIKNDPQEMQEWLAGGVPEVVEENAHACGVGPVPYVSESPVMSVYAQSDGDVYLTYSTTARGLEFSMTYYAFLDRVPLGRNEGDPMRLRIRRRDEYAQAKS